MAHEGQLGLVAVGFQQLAAVLLCLVAGQRHLGALAVVVEEEHPALVIGGHDHIQRDLALFHAEGAGDVITEDARLAVVEIVGVGLVDLTMIREEEQLDTVRALAGEQYLIAVLELLLAAHAQALGRDLLEVAVPREEQVHGVVGNLLLRLLALNGGHLVHDLAAAGFAVLFGDVGQLLHDDLVDACRALENILQVRNRVFEFFDFLGALQDILTVQVAQLDLGHVLGLHLVDAEADHQVRHDLGLLGGVAHDFDGLVNVEQNCLQALEQVQALLLALQIVVGAAAHALGAEGDPLVQDAAHAQHLGLARNQHVKVAGEAVLQRRGLVQARHQLVGVLAALQINRQL